jgi:DNA-binding MarR family transcriptional regulator
MNVIDSPVKLILDEARLINDNIFNATRILLLFLHRYFQDGLQFRELQTILEISDGKLNNNLKNLEENGYLEKSIEKIDNKDINVYRITNLGRNYYTQFINWIHSMENLIKTEEKI